METTIHYVEKVNFEKIEKHVLDDTDRVFYTRHINVSTKEGRFELVLFSDNQENLKLKKRTR